MNMSRRFSYFLLIMLLCLDEVSAIVLDPGYSTTRAGFAGEDIPKSLIPTYYGKYTSDGQEKFIFGDNIFVTPRPGLSVHNPIGNDGIVEDWDTAEKLWEYSFTSRLTGQKPDNPLKNGLNDISNGELPTEMEVETDEKPLSDTPLLMTESGWNPTKAREKTIEIAMEKWDTPAFYSGRNGVLAAYVFILLFFFFFFFFFWLALYPAANLPLTLAAKSPVSQQVKLLHSWSILAPPMSLSPQCTME